jgi:hypothetical protein
MPGVSFLRSKKLRPTKNRVMKNNLPESISLSYLDESSLSDDTSHSLDHEMNLSYENEDESKSNNGVDDDLGFEETQQICRDIEKDLCYDLDQSKKVWFPDNGVADDLGFEETQQICRDIEKDLCYDVDQSKKVWFGKSVQCICL